MSRRAVVLILTLIAWKLVRTDWIVECEAAAADFHPPVSVEKFRATFTPPVSPIWSPPTPEKLTGNPSATWSGSSFFDAGGSYGPASVPTLRINWMLSLVKMAGAGSVLWFLFSLVADLRRERNLA
jgi:hypothetical protein